MKTEIITKYYKRKSWIIDKDWYFYYKTVRISCPEMGGYYLDTYVRHDHDSEWRKIFMPDEDLKRCTEITEKEAFVEIL